MKKLACLVLALVMVLSVASFAQAESKLPVVAIGGICPANIALLKSCKIAGVAVSSAILNAPNPYQASLTLKQALPNALHKGAR